MTPEELHRAGQAVTERMTQLGLTPPQLAQKARVHPGTVRALLNGGRTLHGATMERIVAALGWEPGELSRRIWGTQVALADATTEDLARELCRRLSGNHDHPHVREH